MDQTKGCGWVNASKENRCTIVEAQIKCPKTCNTCDDSESVPSEKEGKDSKSPPPTLEPISRSPISNPTAQVRNFKWFIFDTSN